MQIIYSFISFLWPVGVTPVHRFLSVRNSRRHRRRLKPSGIMRTVWWHSFSTFPLPFAAFFPSLLCRASTPLSRSTLSLSLSLSLRLYYFPSRPMRNSLLSTIFSRVSLLLFQICTSICSVIGRGAICIPTRAPAKQSLS